MKPSKLVESQLVIFTGKSLLKIFLSYAFVFLFYFLLFDLFLCSCKEALILYSDKGHSISNALDLY